MEPVRPRETERVCLWKLGFGSPQPRLLAPWLCLDWAQAASALAVYGLSPAPWLLMGNKKPGARCALGL